MWKWITNRRSNACDELRIDAPRTEPGARMVPRKYLSLYRYLTNRYADVTVLTFSQIEDLLGFALPQLARTQPAWWMTGTTDVDVPPHAAAWILAGRTATANLLTRTVVFERAPLVAARHLA